MRQLTPEHKAAMLAGRLAAGKCQKGAKKEPQTPLAAIRAKCLDCGTTRNYVKWCTCDGLHGTRCALWPFRFGVRPSTARKGPLAPFLDPKEIPDATVPLEK